MIMPCWFSTARLRRAAVSFGSAALIVLSVGCEARDPEAHVWGRVTCKGKPLTDGVVILMPLSEKANSAGAGPLDSRGRFVIQSSRSDIDLIPGRYAISIRPPQSAVSSRESGQSTSGYPVPEKYLNPEKPVLFVDLKAEPLKLDLSLND